MLNLKKYGEMHSLAQSYRKFEQFQEPNPAITQPFCMWKNATSNANLPAAPANFFQQHQYQKNEYQQITNNVSAWPQQPYAQYISQQHIPQYVPQQSMPQHNPWQFHIPPALNKISIHPSKVAKLRPTFWEDFKRIYITEVIAFTMSKSTLFTLVFSFMFLGCIFFLSGFFTATNIYRELNTVHETSKPHTPTETALLQGRPEKMVNMGAGIAYATPKAYRSQGGIKVDQNARRPSAHVEKQIAIQHPHYR